ncbi:MAG: cytochrome c3 family protein [Sideroxyarcus sp.]|nr:cytochrome c3 family protein [Sideroxyarcus sp.]
MNNKKRSLLALLIAVAFAGAGLLQLPVARAEYGDVVINNFSDAAGMRPVVFPHWFHRERFRCKVCHSDLGFQFKAGGNQINMLKILDGEYCGACHDGNIAWSVENCNLCHSGIPNTPTHVHGSTAQQLILPPTETGAALPNGTVRPPETPVPAKPAPAGRR